MVKYTKEKMAKDLASITGSIAQKEISIIDGVMEAFECGIKFGRQAGRNEGRKEAFDEVNRMLDLRKHNNLVNKNKELPWEANN